MHRDRRVARIDQLVQAMSAFSPPMDDAHLPQAEVLAPVLAATWQHS